MLSCIGKHLGVINVCTHNQHRTKDYWSLSHAASVNLNPLCPAFPYLVLNLTSDAMSLHEVAFPKGAVSLASFSHFAPSLSWSKVSLWFSLQNNQDGHFDRQGCALLTCRWPVHRQSDRSGSDHESIVDLWSSNWTPAVINVFGAITTSNKKWFSNKQPSCVIFYQ